MLAFLRRANGLEHGEDGRERDRTVLVVANLSRFAQYVELDLSEFRGVRPVELFGHTTFPAIGELPYLLTLGPQAFYWLALDEVRTDTSMTDTQALPSLAAEGPWTALFERRNRRPVETMLPRLLRTRRWFGAKSRTITAVRIDDTFVVPLPYRWQGEEEGGPEPAIVLLVRVEYLDGEPDTYVVPVTFLPGAVGQRLIEEQPSAALAIVRPADGEPGLLVDAHWVPGFGLAFLQLIARRRQVRGEHGSLVPVASSSGVDVASRTVHDAPSVNVLRGEQSNTSLVFDERVIMKTLRRIEAGENPELEVSRVLTDEVHFENAPTLVGVRSRTAETACPTPPLQSPTDTSRTRATRGTGSSSSSPATSTRCSRTPTPRRRCRRGTRSRSHACRITKRWNNSRRAFSSRRDCSAGASANCIARSPGEPRSRSRLNQ